MAELATYQALLSGSNGDTFENFIRVNDHIEAIAIDPALAIDDAIKEANNIHEYADTATMVAAALSTLGDVVKVGADFDTDFTLYKLKPDGDPAVLADYEIVSAAKADQVPLTVIRDAANSTDTDIVSEKAVRTELDKAIPKTDIALSGEVDAATDATKLINTVELKRKLDALSLTGEPTTPFAATFAGLPPVPTETGNFWTVLTADDGGNVAGIYLKAGTSWVFGTELGRDILELTQAQVLSTTGSDYPSTGLISAERLDQWGVSRRVQRIFNSSISFDFNALGYSDKTAVYVRNQDRANGINVTYGVGGANTLEITHANGTGQTVVGQDIFNLQPSEIVFMEKEGTTIRASIIPAERVVRFDNYAQANGFGAIAHDAIVMIRDTGELFFRRTGANSVVFPLDGEPNADWWRVGEGSYVGYGTTPEKNALGVVPLNTPFFDTNLAKLQRYDTTTDAFQVVFGTTHQPYSINWPSNSTSGSGINFKVTEDPDAVAGVTSINLPDGTEKQIWIVAQQVVGNTPSVGGAGTLGGTVIVRNDAGIISLVSVPSESRWNNSGSWAALSYNQLPNLVASAIGVTDTEIQRIFSNVEGAGVWINLDGTLTQDQSLDDFKPLTAYATGDRFVAPMPLNADFIDTNGAIVNVDYIFEANTDIPNTVAAFDESQADSGNYDLVGVYRVSGTDDRVLSGTGIMLLDPLTSLSNTSVSEYIHWTTTDTPKTIRLVPAPAFVTTWKDYTGNSIAQPTTANEDFILPADSQMWVHRQGNAIQVTFESNEGGSGSIRVFDSISDTDNESFVDGEIIMTRSEGVGATSWIFELGAVEGDYELANVVTGFFNKLRDQTQAIVLDADGGADNVASFSQVDANFGDFTNDLDPTAKFYYVKRNAASTATQSFESGVATVIPADDFDWYLFRRINISTVEFMGKPFSGSGTTQPLEDVIFQGVVGNTGTIDLTGIDLTPYEYIRYELEGRLASGRPYPFTYRRKVSDGFNDLRLWTADGGSTLQGTYDPTGNIITMSYAGAFTIAGNQRIVGIKAQKTVIRPEDLVVTQQILGSALIEERGIFKEIIDDVSASTTGSVTFPNGGFGSSPKVQATAETNGHTINVRNITTTGFTYDQWDVEDIQQGGNFTYRAIGLK